MGITKEESKTIAAANDDYEDPAKTRPKKKGPKGPNPLSVKKKKSKPDNVQPNLNRDEGQRQVELKRKHDADEVVNISTMSTTEGAKKHRHRKRRRKAQDEEGPSSGP